MLPLAWTPMQATGHPLPVVAMIQREKKIGAREQAFNGTSNAVRYHRSLTMNVSDESGIRFIAAGELADTPHGGTHSKETCQEMPLDTRRFERTQRCAP
jgi:Ser-tRNA(Ala) deacylase AlaX